MNDAQPTPHPREHPPYPTDAPISAWLSSSSVQAHPSDLIRVDARAIADARMGVIEHASLVLQRDATAVRVRYAGPTMQTPSAYTDPRIPVLTLRDQFVLPALVNAHAHLDLTHIAPQPHTPDDGFVPWVDMIRAKRATEDDHITRSVRSGIEKSLAGGVIAVGDIAGAPAGRLCDTPARILAASPLIGVSYLEFFGIGTATSKAVRRVCEYLDDQAPALIDQLTGSGIQLGFQPHAPNTVDLGVYRWITRAASQRGIPLCTHLAETIEERMFIHDGIGPQRAMLERFGIWDESVLEYTAKGKHPIEHLRPVLEMHPYLVAHANDCEDAGIETLARTGASVAYCPRAAAYFHAEEHFGVHRYREMLDAGINVCLGTDSIVNLDTPDRISTLDDMRLLHQQGDRDEHRLLAMGTRSGATALGLDPQRFTIAADACPIGLISVPIGTTADTASAWDLLMGSKSTPNWLYLE